MIIEPIGVHLDYFRYTMKTKQLIVFWHRYAIIGNEFLYNYLRFKITVIALSGAAVPFLGKPSAKQVAINYLFRVSMEEYRATQMGGFQHAGDVVRFERSYVPDTPQHLISLRHITRADCVFDILFRKLLVGYGLM